mmetsp:Transcript_57651/g.126333  ORF Transcript_57651/g.126333 Transcript_57651/m.126333 type:complete len:225 (+) Transcript_57651:502-1176(+)
MDMLTVGTPEFVLKKATAAYWGADLDKSSGLHNEPRWPADWGRGVACKTQTLIFSQQQQTGYETVQIVRKLDEYLVGWLAESQTLQLCVGIILRSGGLRIVWINHTCRCCELFRWGVPVQLGPHLGEAGQIGNPRKKGLTFCSTAHRRSTPRSCGCGVSAETAWLEMGQTFEAGVRGTCSVFLKLQARQRTTSRNCDTLICTTHNALRLTPRNLVAHDMTTNST